MFTEPHRTGVPLPGPLPPQGWVSGSGRAKGLGMCALLGSAPDHLPLLFCHLWPCCEARQRC